MWNLSIRNIGGIKSGNATLNSGVNIIQASNFQGKTSFMSSIQTIMGTTGLSGGGHPLTEGAEDGEIRLETEDGEYEITLTRSTGVDGDAISLSGNTFLTDDKDRHSARLFAFLGEDNPIRLAVRDGNEERLTQLLKKPLEIEDIDTKKETKKRLIVEREKKLAAAKKAAKKLPKAQEKVTQLENDLEDLRAKRDELEEKVEEDSEQKELRSDLSDKETELNSTKNRIERVENQIERKQSKLEEHKDELEALEIPSDPKHEGNLGEKRDRINELSLNINLLDDLFRSNRAIIDEGAVDLITDVERTLSGDEIACWVCGEPTNEETIMERLDEINEKKQNLQAEKSSLESEIEEIESRKKEIRKKKREEERLEDNIKSLNVGIEENEHEKEQLEKEAEALQQEVEALEAEYDEIEQDEEEDASELKRVQSEIGSKESKLEMAEERLERLEGEADGRKELQDEIDELKAELDELKGYEEAKLEEVTNQFEVAMSDMISKFAPGFESARLKRIKDNEETIKYEIIVAREGRETELNRLSEGERELIGIVTALAGYRTFNVNEDVPCILLDGLGQLAAEHIRNLIDYLEDTSEMLVTTAYPEAGEFEGTTLSPSDWDVISDQVQPA